MIRARVRSLWWAALLILMGFVAPLATHDAVSSPATTTRPFDDPPLPEYVTGDECLFCHRFKTGTDWQTNRHRATIRAATASAVEQLKLHPELGRLANEVEFVMGGKNRLRFLKRGKRYGTLELLGAELAPATKETPPNLLHAPGAAWNADQFGRSCAGCHTTQTDSRTKAFASISLDCYVCHGAATLEHANDTRRILLAGARKDSPSVVVSVCCQCHLRGGRSQSSGLPYPNNFVAGGDLFRDFQVDWLLAGDARLNAGDRHVYENARDVLEHGATDLTCLSCHAVHAQSTTAHRRQPQSEICLNCHHATGPKSVRKNYEVHSATCGY